MDWQANYPAALTLPSFHADAGPTEAEFAPGDLIYNRYSVRYWMPGGSSDVYLCHEMGTWDWVAVKIPRSRPMDRTGDEQQRIFDEEVRNWADLQEHPNLARCYYAGHREGRWFLVLEWVGAPDKGKDLHNHLADLAAMDAPVRLAQAIRLAIDICDGLAYIHANGIIHGDLKPPNVLIGKNGRAKITDLGRGSRRLPARASRLRGPHVNRAQALRIATPEYMAPELWDGRPPSVQTDIYAVGCILHELATGKRPFAVENPRDLAEWNKLHHKQPPPSLPGPPESLRPLVADCLHKNPSRRPSSAAEARERLERLLPPDVSYPPQEDRQDDDHERLPGMRSQLRVSLFSAAGRTEDAIEQQAAGIRKQMQSVLTHGIRFVSDEPSSMMAGPFNDLGGLASQTDSWMSATGEFITAIRLDPQFAAAYANLGTNYRRLHCPTIAIVAFNRAIELDPDDHRLYLKRARLLSEYGWNDAAHFDIKRALAMAPDDPDACYAMADSLAALGRDDEVLEYRAKGMLPGRGPNDGLSYLRPMSIRRKADLLAARMGASLLPEDDEHHAAAITGYAAALKMAPWKTDILYYLGKARLDAGDSSGAIADLRAFLKRASTTHPLAPKARDMVHQARSATGDLAGRPDPHDEPDEGVYPLSKPPDYIASKVPGSQADTLSIVNLMPLGPDQRLALLDMLYSGSASRKREAGRLLWNAYIEHYEQLAAHYGELARNLGDGAWQETGRQFAAALLTSRISVGNGFGLPVLLTEAQLSPNPLHDVRFSGSGASLGWASSGAIGVWEVVPGVQSEHIVLDDPRQAPLFSADAAAYLVADDHQFGICYRDAGRPDHGWNAGDGTVLAACFCGDLVAVGMAPGSVTLLDPERVRDTETVQLAASEQDGSHDDMRLWQSADREVTVFTGTAFFQVQPREGKTGAPVAIQLNVPRPGEDARLLDASEARILWAPGGDELLVSRLDEPGADVRLAAPYSTNGGFTAAAVSCDGTVVAALCDSFLHVWRTSEGVAGYTYLPMTPQAWGQCVAVSADGRYIAVGTDAGSVLVYVTMPAGEP